MDSHITIENPGRDEVQAIFLKSALKLSKSGIMPSRGLTKTKLLKLASHITGTKYKRGANGINEAIFDLETVIDTAMSKED
tara:strand:- start:192 stop:434 length:243 start_codon:yes stop_codon:yes gene_type:complete